MHTVVYTPLGDSPAVGAAAGESAGTRFLLGLPYLADNELVATARRLGAPVLLSANALSRWRRDAGGTSIWHGFNTASLKHGTGLDMALDSAGFVAAVRYRRFPWRVDDYIDLCAAHPWRWFASMDWCVEPEAAPNEEVVLNRISGTVRLNMACHNLATQRGIADRLMPVIQGWRPDHYLRCIDRMGSLLEGRHLLGIGSMCRRHMAGPAGVIHILDRLDRAFGRDPVAFHLFGLKSSVLQVVAGHPRVASVDSQAYGIHARRAAIQIREMQPDFSKSNAFTAKVMGKCYLEQRRRIEAAAGILPAATGFLDLQVPEQLDPVEARYRATVEEMRELHEAGEIDYGDLNPLACYEAAFCCETEL